MQVGLFKLFAPLVMAPGLVNICQAREINFTVDVHQPGTGQDWSQNGMEADIARLSWQVGLHDVLMPKKFNGTAGFTYSDNNKGKTGYETSISWMSRDLILQSRIAKSWLNQDATGGRAEISDTWYIIESSYDLSSRPYSGFLFSYGAGFREYNQPDADSPYAKEVLTDVQAKFKFRHELLSFAVRAGQFHLQDNTAETAARKENQFYVQGSLFPEYPVSINPSFGLQYHSGSLPALKGKAEKMETALGLVYKPVQSGYQFSVKTAYENEVAPYASEEKDVFKFAAKIVWKPASGRFNTNTNWTIDYQLKDIRDNVNPNASSSDWSISLIWRMPIG